MKYSTINITSSFGDYDNAKRYSVIFYEKGVEKIFITSEICNLIFHCIRHFCTLCT